MSLWVHQYGTPHDDTCVRSCARQQPARDTFNDILALKRTLNLAVGFVLAEGVHGPDGSRYPANKRDLEQQAEETRDRPANRKEGQPGEDKCDQKSHGASLHAAPNSGQQPSQPSNRPLRRI